MAGKAYNFLLICYGKTESVNASVSYLQKAFRAYTSAQSVRLYDSDTLWKAEAEPERLSKSASLSFRTVKSYYNKCYLGFFEPCENLELHKRLFASTRDDWTIPSAVPYYSKQTLLSILNGDFCEETEDELPLPADMEISYRYEIFENGISCARISCHLKDTCTEDPAPYLAWCNAVIQELDAGSPDCFRSAYLSYAHPERTVLHENLYRRYDVSCLEHFLLGAEWSAYVSNGILPKDTSLISVQPLQNGVQYRANVEIRKFDEGWREKLYTALQELLIPAYTISSWSEVWERRKAIRFSPPAVHVFHDPNNADNPLILFPYRMDSAQLRILNELRGLDPMGSFMKKEP